MVLRRTKLQKQTRYIAQRHSVTQEQRIADETGGRVTKASGCGTERGDSRNKAFIRIENKCTEKNSYAISTKVIEKLENAALPADEIPIIQIEFIDKNGNIKHSLVVTPYCFLRDIIEILEESRH